MSPFGIDRTDRRPHAVYLGGDRVIVGLPNGRHLLAFGSDLSLTPDLVTRGMYDWPFWRFLHRHVRGGDHVVDIGANIGLFTIAMANLVGPTGRVTAYEADPDVAMLLADNVTSNWFGEWVTVLPMAAAAVTGTLTLNRHPRYRGSSAAGVADISAHAVTEGYEQVEVEAERVDERLRNSPRLRLVKIDVEGGEAAVVEGLCGLLDRSMVDYLDLEIVPDNASSPTQLAVVVAELLEQRHARPHRIDERGRLVRLDSAHVLDGSRHPHVVFDLRATTPR